MKLKKHSCILTFYLLVWASLFLPGGQLQAEKKGNVPLVFVFQKQKDPALIKAEADKVTSFLSTKLERKVESRVPSDYSSAVQALVSRTADIAYLDSFGFLLAKRDGDAHIILAEERPDVAGKLRTDYDSVFVVKKESPLHSFSDVLSTASKLRMVFTSPTSTSGYLIPYRRFAQEGLLKPGQDPKEVFKSVGFGGSYVQALEQVLEGRADICAVSFYSVEGPRAKSFLSQDKLDQLRVLARTPGVPTHVIAARGGLGDEIIQKIELALMELSTEHPELLADVYGASKFTKVDEEAHVRASREALEVLGIPLDKKLLG